MDNITKLAIDVTLGDGWLGKKREGNNACLRIEHAIKQIQYARYKEDLLYSAGLKINSKRYISTTFRNKGKEYYRIDVSPDAKLNRALDLLYVNGVKTVKNVIEMLDERSLAFLFLDDGSAHLTKYALKKYAKVIYAVPYIGTFKFSIQGYSLEDAYLLAEWLETFNIRAKINQTPSYKHMPTLTVHDYASKLCLVNIVSKYHTADMEYKTSHPLTAAQTSIAYKEPRIR